MLGFAQVGLQDKTQCSRTAGQQQAAQGNGRQALMLFVTGSAIVLLLLCAPTEQSSNNVTSSLACLWVVHCVVRGHMTNCPS